MEIKNRLTLLRNLLAEQDISAMIIPSNDPHFGEYVPDYYKTIEWLTGFTGEAGTLVVAQESAALWTDSRFFVQAEAQLQGTGVQLMKLKVEGTPSIQQWLKENLEEGDIVAMDEELFSYQEYSSMVDELSPLTPSLIEDPFDVIWEDRPSLQFNPIRYVDETITGESVASKHSRLVDRLSGPVPFAYIVTALDEICWLCNIRGTDVEYNPLVLSYAVVTPENIHLFLMEQMMEASAINILSEQGVIFHPYEDIVKFLTNLPKDCIRIYSSGKISAKNFFASMENIHHNAPFAPYAADPMTGGVLANMKAVKNEVELVGFRKAYVEDAKAQIKFFNWIKENVNNGITEYQAALKLIEFRSECPDYLGESFPPIVAYGPNAALPHYGPSEEVSSVILPKGFLLIDTGAHYTYGTTDTTRTLAVGELTQEQKDDYTAVLKGMINLSMAKFNKGTRGAQLDMLARGPIMARGKIYWHGTSHGIGHNLCVHEGPQSIRMEENSVSLALGMVLSNEPAVYIVGEYGIRIENTIVVAPWMKNDFAEFYQFETLNVLPINTEPINYDMLDEPHKQWLEEYNSRCL